jgi:tRNA C32,U32 (ribose-2'-O)-methylase TrmJ
VRSSGRLFTNQIATEQQQKSLLKEKKSISIAPLCKLNIVSYAGFYNPTALVVGMEATGLTQEWRDAATQNIIIPMQGEIDSMNVLQGCRYLLLKLKTTRFLNQQVISEIKKEKTDNSKKREMRKQIIIRPNNVLSQQRFSNNRTKERIGKQTLTAFNVPGIAVKGL